MADRIEEFKLDYSYKYPKLYDDSLLEIKKKIASGIKWRGIDKRRIIKNTKTELYMN